MIVHDSRWSNGSGAQLSSTIIDYHEPFDQGFTDLSPTTQIKLLCIAINCAKACCWLFYFQLSKSSHWLSSQQIVCHCFIETFKLVAIFNIVGRSATALKFYDLKTHHITGKS